MIDLGKLTATIAADATSFHSTMAKVGSSVSSGIGSLGKLAAIGGVVTAAVGILSAGVAKLTGTLLSGNSEFERYAVQFTVLMGNAKAAKDRLAELTEFAKVTPFELPEVVRADKILQAFGFHVENAVKRFGASGVEIRTIAGDVAAGTGAGFEDIVFQIGKLASGATGEALMRFAELGIVTRRELQAMGIEFTKSGELADRSAKGIDAVTTIVIEAMKNKFGGMMEAQSKTFEGMMSNLKDWFGQAKRIVMEPLFEVVKGKLKDLLDFLDTDAAKNMLSRVAEGMAAGVSKMLGWGEKLVAWIRGVDWSPVITGALTYIAGLQRLYEITSVVVKWIVQHKVALIALCAALAAVLIYMNPVGVAIVAIIAAVGLLVRNWDTLKKATAITWLYIRDFIAEAWDNIAGASETAINGIIKGLNAVIRGLNIVNPFKDIQFISDVVLARIGRVTEREWALANAIGYVAHEVEGQTDAVAEYVPVVEDAGEATKEFAYTADDLGESAKDAKDELKELQDAMRGIAKLAFPGEAALSDQLFNMEQDSKRLKLQLLEMGGRGAEGAEPLEKAIEKLERQMDILRTKGELTWDPMRRMIERVVEPIQEMAFTEKINSLLTLDPDTLSRMKEAAGTLGTQLQFLQAMKSLGAITNPNVESQYGEWSAARTARGESLDMEAFSRHQAAIGAPSFQYGGRVPGPIGMPRLVVAHGGEEFAGVGRRLGGGGNQSTANDNRSIVINVNGAGEPANVLDRFVADPRVMQHLRPRPVW